MATGDSGTMKKSIFKTGTICGRVFLWDTAHFVRLSSSVTHLPCQKLCQSWRCYWTLAPFCCYRQINKAAHLDLSLSPKASKASVKALLPSLVKTTGAGPSTNFVVSARLIWLWCCFQWLFLCFYHCLLKHLVDLEQIKTAHLHMLRVTWFAVAGCGGYELRSC